MEPVPGLDLAHPPFDLLTDVEQARVQRAVDMGFHPAGTVLLPAGAASEHVHVILKGVVRAWDEPGGQGDDAPRLFADFGPGDVFGAWAVIAGRARHRYQAAEDVLDFLIPATLFRELLADNPAFAAWFHEGLALKRQRASREQQSSEVTELMLTRVGDAQLAPAVQVPVTTTVAEAARQLRESRVDCLLVDDPDAGPGMLTRTDLLEAVALNGLTPDDAVAPLAQRPVIGVRAQDVLFQALVTMTEHHIERVLVTEGEARTGGRMLGTLGMAEVLAHYASHSHLISLRLARAETLAEVAEAARSMTALVRQLHAQGARMSYLMELVSALNSRILGRVFDEVVPEPLRNHVCLLVLGSEGRREQILKTDQDNALVLDDGFEWDGLEDAMRRFSEALADIGYPPCPGGVMASNPHWRMSRAQWLQRIEHWRREGDGQSVLDLSIAIDARPLAGNPALFEPVAERIATLGGDDILLRQLARATLDFSSPLNLFGRVRGDADGIDLKKGGVFPLVNGIRMLSLRHGVRRHNSFDRCAALLEAGALPPDLGRDVPQALAVFMRLRLGAQLQALAAGREAGNRLDPAALRRLDRELLRDAFRVVNAFKDHIRATFSLYE